MKTLVIIWCSIMATILSLPLFILYHCDRKLKWKDIKKLYKEWLR